MPSLSSNVSPCHAHSWDLSPFAAVNKQRIHTFCFLIHWVGNAPDASCHSGHHSSQVMREASTLWQPKLLLPDLLLTPNLRFKRQFPALSLPLVAQLCLPSSMSISLSTAVLAPLSTNTSARLRGYPCELQAPAMENTHIFTPKAWEIIRAKETSVIALLLQSVLSLGAQAHHHKRTGSLTLPSSYLRWFKRRDL